MRGHQPAQFQSRRCAEFYAGTCVASTRPDTLAAAATCPSTTFPTSTKPRPATSPIKHFLNMKMEYACHLLDSGGLGVKGVASALLGYDDPLYFPRLFSKTVGMSPRAYRNSVRK